MKIAIIGTGYVGLVSGACFADLGHEIVCIDTNLKKIRSLQKGITPFFEPQLSSLVKKNIEKRSLLFSKNYKNIKTADLVLICVDTPNKKNGSPDLTNFNLALTESLEHVKDNCVIVTKSTVPIGTHHVIKKKIKKISSSRNITIHSASNPEFLKEGAAVSDFFKPDRIIVGADNDFVHMRFEELYKPLNHNKNRIQHMSIASAELTKYASNAFLATKISFINEIAKIAELTDANIHEIRLGMGSDKRIGNDFLYAGLGFGGSCFPKDLIALINTQKKLGLESRVIYNALDSNNNQVRYFVNKIQNRYPKNEFKRLNVAIWGVSFKPETDDLRESIPIKIINMLSKKVHSINIYDPVCKKKNILNELTHTQNISFGRSKYSVIKSADILIIGTEWREFWQPDFSKLKDLVIFDGRNILNRKTAKENKIELYGIGV